MNSYLRQATASQGRVIGPCLDDTDFKTASTGLTIANTDIKLIVNGAASVNKNSGGGTHRVNGVYGVTFDATDTATCGELFVSVKMASTLPVFHSFYVLTALAYDAIFGSTAFAGNGSAVLGATWVGTLSAISATTFTLPATPGVDHGATVVITLLSGTNAAPKSRIATYSGSGEVWTVDPAWNAGGQTTPSGTITAVVAPVADYPTTSVPSAKLIATGFDAVTGYHPLGDG